MIITEVRNGSFGIYVFVHRKPSALTQSVAEEWKAQVNYHKFMQWCLARQWKKLKKYANDRTVKLVGDIPIFVAHHSADVWSNQEAFSLEKMKASCRCRCPAGLF